jgi:lysophospholipase L1-like esterase
VFAAAVGHEGGYHRGGPFKPPAFRSRIGRATIEHMSRDDRPARPALYAALGDSISIDEYAGGPGLGGPSLFAHNRDDTFPQWRGRDLATAHPDLRYHLLAVDGGTTDSLLHHQLPQLERSGAAPTVVTLTIGGNDLLGSV